MPFSSYLNGKRKDCAELVQALGRYFPYVSILGTDVRSTSVRADKRTTAVQEGRGECGFVVKMNDGRAFFEYSLDDISGDKAALADRIRAAVATDAALSARMIAPGPINDAPMQQDFLRETDFTEEIAPPNLVPDGRCRGCYVVAQLGLG